MSYKFIAITAKIAPLDIVLTESYAKGVMAESRLASAAPELLNACRTADALLAAANAPGRSIEFLEMLIESAQGILRGAIERATNTEAQS